MDETLVAQAQHPAVSAVFLQELVVFIEKSKDGGEVKTFVNIAQAAGASDTFAHVQASIEVDHTFAIAGNALAIAGGDGFHAAHFTLVQVEEIVFEEIQRKIRGRSQPSQHLCAEGGEQGIAFGDKRFPAAT